MTFSGVVGDLHLGYQKVTWKKLATVDFQHFSLAARMLLVSFRESVGLQSFSINAEDFLLEIQLRQGGGFKYFSFLPPTWEDNPINPI